ncbi:uncharacterized protein LOC101846988 [Aplysia californica]|uniref:Uncharacterized protein LOC101846988 n=1 Tax=Aplysia californica TaxID=6500 RepID=A0ABM1W0C2_APLCA|nr:uncharacterized protein LOC101846988 [Aplysia californica]
MSTSVQYVQHQDEDEEDDLGQLTHTQVIYSQMRARGKHWPKAIGVVEIIIGFILTVLGAAEVFIVPMVESEDGQNLIEFKKENCYGVGMLAGLVMVLTGSTAIRASLSKRNTTVYRFFNLTIVALLVYIGLTITLIIGYANGWTTPDKYKPGSSLREVHVFVTISTVLALLFALTGFVQYFDVICCGEFPLWTMWVKCLCFCCYRQLSSAHALLPGRPQSRREESGPVIFHSSLLSRGQREGISTRESMSLMDER